MRKQLWAIAAGLLVISTVAVSAGEKRYRIHLVSANGNVFGQPVAFQEGVPTPAPLYAPGVPEPTPVAPIPPGPSGGLQPIPETYSGPIPPVDSGYQSVELYSRVKYSDLHNVHPFAVKKIVAVKDPCATRRACGTCAPPCVYVMICVPPNCNFKYDVKRSDHSKVEYDYGDYEIEITSRNGIVSVDYDD